jgi:hypothetical protein
MPGFSDDRWGLLRDGRTGVWREALRSRIFSGSSANSFCEVISDGLVVRLRIHLPPDCAYICQQQDCALPVLPEYLYHP